MTDGNDKKTIRSPQTAIWKPTRSPISLGGRRYNPDFGSDEFYGDLQYIIPDTAGRELDRPGLPANDDADFDSGDGSLDGDGF